jgi:hypothetical protein
MASCGVPSVVALEIATTRRSTEDTCGRPPADLPDERREPAVGSAPHPRRTPQTWHRCRSDHGGEIYVEETAAPIARLEDVSSQSCRRHCGDRHVRRADDLVSAVVWISRPATCTPRASVARRDNTSQCRMAGSSADRGLWPERTATLYHSRSRRRVWRCIPPAPRRDGDTGPTDLGAVAMAKRVCREANRLGPAGVS